MYCLEYKHSFTPLCNTKLNKQIKAKKEEAGLASSSGIGRRKYTKDWAATYIYFIQPRY